MADDWGARRLRSGLRAQIVADLGRRRSSQVLGRLYARSAGDFDDDEGFMHKDGATASPGRDAVFMISRVVTRRRADATL